MRQIQRWDELSLEEQKEEYAKQALMYEFRLACQQWLRNYIRLARAMADAFGEEEVLDILERTWWDLQFEGGRTWRAEFDRDPSAALDAMYHRWHDGCQGLTMGVYDVEKEGDRWDILIAWCKQREVALELGERKILISQCMSDLAAVCGWGSQVVMDFPNALLRGDPYCHQIRWVAQDADPSLDHWSREVSEKFGWRSVQRVEE